ncbi:Nucleoside diphosphate-linked moiety X motif 17 [Bulinus truncatus]|nr:Nucleoside diphosphate-linked moiety X motif 17 [Bulinus truncatus]
MSFFQHRRILVSFLTPVGERLAEFSECILSFFGFKDDHGYLHVELKENRLILRKSKCEEKTNILIKHPAFCPVQHLTADTVTALPEEIRTRGVDVGVATILESCDGKILLTRRAKHLNIFPGIWVPPGGHLEENETLLEAGLRELREETGLYFTKTDFINHTSEILGLWESVYPPVLALGPPTRHHIVVYFHIQLKGGLTADKIDQQIKFEPAEVDATVWLDRDIIKAIAESYDGQVTDAQVQHLPHVVRALILDENQRQCMSEISTAPFYRCLTSDLSNTERVSTGTKFALKQFLLKN